LRLLLDSCTFLWIVEGSDSLSPSSTAAFSDPVNDLLLSSVSAWEIVLKNRLGKLPLPEPAERFVPRYREVHGIEPLALDEESVLQLSRLPELHKDPFDRMLICQAIAHGLAILTSDPLITQYPVRTIW
jgi:PIN domain nuclease of toxin-antitoxin system